MNIELLYGILFWGMSIFIVVIVLLLLHPRSRHYLSNMGQTSNKRRLWYADLAHVFELIFYPIIWLIKLLFRLFD